jgi:hypothetical protein
VKSAALKGASDAPTPFNYEMAQLYQSGRLPDVNFANGLESIALFFERVPTRVERSKILVADPALTPTNPLVELAGTADPS